MLEIYFTLFSIQLKKKMFNQNQYFKELGLPESPIAEPT